MMGKETKTNGSRVRRRAFLAATATGLGALTLGPFIHRSRPSSFTGGIVGGNRTLGHALRDGKLPRPSRTEDVAIVIVGGGISGLAAGRKLHRSGFNDFQILELESRPGGNALSGRNKVSSFPWGAHYVPIVGSDATEVSGLFEELGVITGRTSNGSAIYREEFLCADPMERLFIHGRWQEGLVPQIGLSLKDRQIIESFFAEMQRFKSARGFDGRRAFTIPVDASSRDPQFTRFDAINMASYLQSNGWLACEPLRWYVNYCCRDDYGAGIDQISGWAGIHYFASRDGQAANASENAVVTWPEGNGWFVQKIKSDFVQNIRPSCAVWNVEPDKDAIIVDAYDAQNRESICIRTRGVVWAAPRFIAHHVIPSLRQTEVKVDYSPWMVANLTVNNLPDNLGISETWDNVLHESNSLGYVMATHQSLGPAPKNTVLTYYQPLDSDSPSAAREHALNQSYEGWCDQIFADLERAHPNLRKHVAHLDVWLWGHAMVRPVTGFIWSSQREQMQPSIGNIVFAHSDASGIAIFEEAYTRGTQAATELLLKLNMNVPKV